MIKRSIPTGLRAGTIKRLHVNRHVIAKNRKTGETEPALTIQTSKGSIRAHHVTIMGESRMVYRPERPLSCGATAWIETNAALRYR